MWFCVAVIRDELPLSVMTLLVQTKPQLDHNIYEKYVAVLSIWHRMLNTGSLHSVYVLELFRINSA